MHFFLPWSSLPSAAIPLISSFPVFSDLHIRFFQVVSVVSDLQWGFSNLIVLMLKVYINPKQKHLKLRERDSQGEWRSFRSRYIMTCQFIWSLLAPQKTKQQELYTSRKFLPPNLLCTYTQLFCFPLPPYPAGSSCLLTPLTPEEESCNSRNGCPLYYLSAGICKSNSRGIFSIFIWPQ